MIFEKTKSICPICEKTLDAEIFEKENKVFIKKTCLEHGSFENTYWSDAESYTKAESYDYKGKGLESYNTNIQQECPTDCGLCGEHNSQTVLGLIDITNRCNLRCPVCFANAAVSKSLFEPSFEEIRGMLINLRNNKPVSTPAIQYSGGEPTVREDLPELIELAREEGFVHTQIATNGINIGNSLKYAKKLKNAGLNIIYLQFDGLTSDIYEITRDNDLYQSKLDAIENCRKANINVVLVPTLIKGVNDHQVGDILNFAIKNLDVIRGVNFQPVSFAGRTPSKNVEEQRITIPDFQKLVEEQTNSQILTSDFYPASSVKPISDIIERIENKPQVVFTCHHHCGSGTYIFVDGDKLIPITKIIDVDKFFDVLKDSIHDMDESKYRGAAKSLARTTWELPKSIHSSNSPNNIGIKRLLSSIFKDRSYSALGEFHNKTLLISCMHFMDGWNFDTKRLNRCVIHYAIPDGRIIPFCSMNLLHRPDIEKQFSKPFNEINN